MQSHPPQKRARDASPSRKPSSLGKTPPMENQVTFSLDQTKDAAAHFKKYGYVVIRDVLNKAERIAFIKELVKKLLLKQPWSKAAPLKVFDPVTKKELDIDRDTEKYIEAFTRANMDKETLAMLYASAPFHSGFGAPSDGIGFHLHMMWLKRQDPMVYQMFCEIMDGREDLWVDINRPIVKYPGKGDHEFLHWDMNPLNFSESDDFTVESVAGKVNATKSRFLMVPGSHTKDAHRHIARQYKPLYPGIKPNSPKFALSPTKEDPADLVLRARYADLPEGSAVFWSTKLLHGVLRLSTKAAPQLGFYLGAMPAVDRPEYKRLSGISELEDRINCQKDCTAPSLYPSMDKVEYVPRKYTNFIAHLDPFVAKANPGWPGLVTKVLATGSKEGTEYLSFKPVHDPDATPFQLSTLGKKLLGILPYK